MFDLLTGIRVVELAQWVMVPSAGALLADFGADVIKIEHPDGGDPYRGLTTFALRDSGTGESPSVAHTNRGKRSIGLDVKTEDGRQLLLDLIASADVLLTSFRAPALARLGLDVESARALNPRLVYARGNAFGTEGTDRDAPGYDATAFWSRGGFAYSLTADGAEYPAQMRPALGDRATSMALALGVCAALTKRERTGSAPLIDVSLMGTAGWMLAGDLLGALHGIDPKQEPHRSRNPNPLTNVYRTFDGRWITLNGLQPDRYWDELCCVIDRVDLIVDPRFVDGTARAANADACLAELDATFASAPYDEWVKRFADFTGPWAPVQGAKDYIHDPQVRDNGWIVQLDGEDRPVYAIAGPVSTDAGDRRLQRSPRIGEHTAEIVAELRRSPAEIADLENRDVIS